MNCALFFWRDSFVLELNRLRLLLGKWIFERLTPVHVNVTFICDFKTLLITGSEKIFHWQSSSFHSPPYLKRNSDIGTSNWNLKECRRGERDISPCLHWRKLPFFCLRNSKRNVGSSALTHRERKLNVFISRKRERGNDCVEAVTRIHVERREMEIFFH